MTWNPPGYFLIFIQVIKNFLINFRKKNFFKKIQKNFFSKNLNLWKNFRKFFSNFFENWYEKFWWLGQKSGNALGDFKSLSHNKTTEVFEQTYNHKVGSIRNNFYEYWRIKDEIHGYFRDILTNDFLLKIGQENYFPRGHYCSRSNVFKNLST